MFYLLGLVLALLPSYLIRFSIWGFPTTLLEIFVVGFLFVSLVQSKQVNYNKIKALGQINYAIGLFALAGIISALISPNQHTAIGQLKAFILEPALFFYALVLTIKTRDQVNLVLKFLFISAGLVSLFGLFQYVTFIHLPLRFWGTGVEVERITSVFDYPNALALYLAPLFGFYFSLLLSAQKILKTKWVEWGTLGVIGLALVLTFSRGGLFAVILICTILLIRKFGFKKTLIPLFITTVLLILIPGGIRQRVSLGLHDPSSTVHFELWQIGFDRILTHPVLGTGLGGFSANNVTYPHNIFLNFWLEMGLLGLLSFCGVLIFAFQKQKKPNSFQLAAGVYLLIMLVHGLVDVPYFKNDLAVLFWFMISLFYI